MNFSLKYLSKSGPWARLYDAYFNDLKLINLLSMCNFCSLETYACSLNVIICYYIVGNTISLDNEF